MLVTRSGECGNSPKNAYVEDLIIDLFTGGDLSARLVAQTEIPKLPVNNAQALTILHAISHGRVGAGNGMVEVDGQALAFAVVIEFATTKANSVRDIKLYLGA